MAASSTPKPELRAGSLWLAVLHPAAAHSMSSRAAATNTPPPWRRRRRAGSPPKRHQRASARGRHQRARRRGPEIGSGCVRVRLWAPGPSQEGGDAAERGCRLPGARLHAEAQVGGEEGAGREEGSLTRFSASLGARRLGRVTLRPASGLNWSGLPYTLLRVPASRIQVTRRRPRPAPPLCATLRFPQSRLPCLGLTSGARPKALPPSLRAHWMEL